jgi:hypothetical protein
MYPPSSSDSLSVVTVAHPGLFITIFTFSM